MFKGILIEKDDLGYRAGLRELDETNLPAGDVVVRVHYSTLNYKDALAITGKSPVVRRFPMVPGIDLAGAVEESSHADCRVGDLVILNGWGVGKLIGVGWLKWRDSTAIGWCHCRQPSRPIRLWRSARPDLPPCFAYWHWSGMASLQIEVRSW